MYIIIISLFKHINIIVLIKSSNASIVLHALSGIRWQSFIFELIDNLPSLSNVPLYFLHVLVDIGLVMSPRKQF